MNSNFGISVLFRLLFLSAGLLSLSVFAEQDVNADLGVIAFDHGDWQLALTDIQNRADFNYNGNEANAVSYLQQAIAAQQAGNLNAAVSLAAQAANSMNAARQTQPGQIDVNARVPGQHGDRRRGGYGEQRPGESVFAERGGEGERRDFRGDEGRFHR